MIMRYFLPLILKHKTQSLKLILLKSNFATYYSNKRKCHILFVLNLCQQIKRKLQKKLKIKKRLLDFYILNIIHNKLISIDVIHFILFIFLLILTVILI